MTRKDSILLAGGLRQSMLDHGQARRDAVLSVAANIAGWLKENNHSFDQDHFLAVVRGEKALESRPPRKKKVVVLSARGLHLADDPHAAGCAAGKREGK